MKPRVAVVGDTRVAEPTQSMVLVDLGELLIDLGVRIQTGGVGDLPTLVGEGARRHPRFVDGDLVALLPSFEGTDDSGGIALPTGLDLMRNFLVANAHAVIAIGGGAGTLSEVAIAWQLRRPIFAWTGGGWSARLAGTCLDHRQERAIQGFDNLRELAGPLRRTLGESTRPYPGIPTERV